MHLYKDGPPCKTCKPELKACNRPFFILYDYCSDQVIMGGVGPVALNSLSVSDAMKDFRVSWDERVLFSSRVRTIANVVFNERHKEYEKKMAATKKK